MKTLRIVLTLSCGVLAACSGGGSSSSSAEEEDTETLVGVFLDSAVNNLSYASPSFSGVTSPLGGFDYAEGETTTFSYLGLTIGSVTMSSENSIVTPLQLAGASGTDNQTVRNLLVLLQSFDIDQNPSNGIELGTAFEIDLSSIDVTSATFSEDLSSHLTNNGLVLDLVSEEDAVDHFELTLAGLDASSLSLVGSWAERSAGGEVESVLSFTENGTLNATGFDDCPADSEFIAATLASARRNCSSESESYSWGLSGNTIIISSGDTVADRCTIRNSTPYMVEAACLTDEYVRFERQITELSPALIAQSYRNLENSGASYSVLTFAADQQGGGYEYLNSGSDPSNTGEFSSWSASGTSLSVTGTDGAGDDFNTTFELQDAVSGALVADSGDGISAMIPEFQSGLASYLTARNLKVFDAITGKCKMLMISVAEIPEMTTDTLEYREPVNDEICDASNVVAVDQGSVATQYAFSIVDGDYIRLESADYERRCDPIDLLTSDDSGNYWYMACATSDSSVDNQIELEIWYNAY